MKTITKKNAELIRTIATFKSYDVMYLCYLCKGYLSLVKFLKDNEAEIREINLNHIQTARCLDILMRR